MGSVPVLGHGVDLMEWQSLGHVRFQMLFRRFTLFSSLVLAQSLACGAPGASLGTLVLDGDDEDEDEAAENGDSDSHDDDDGDEGDDDGDDEEASEGSIDLDFTPFTFDIPATELAPADLDGDGHLDLATVVKRSGGLSTVVGYAGDGTGRLKSADDLHYPNIVDLVPRVILGLDTDGDGRDSVITVVEDSLFGTTSVLVEDPKSTSGWRRHPVQPSSLGAFPVIVGCRADFDDSQDLCIASASETAQALSLLGPQADDAAISEVEPAYPSLAAWADFDGDTYDDVLVSSTPDELRLYRAGASDEKGEWAMALVGNPDRLMAADVDGDGLPDAVLVGDNREGHGVTYVDVAINRGTGFRAPVRTALPIDEIGGLVVANLNGDARQDFVVQEVGHGQLPGSVGLVALVAGPDAEMHAIPLPAEHSCECSPIAVGDYNEDGIDDVLGVSDSTDNVFMLRSNR